jgi:predicted PurR-regulated permease PerM
MIKNLFVDQFSRYIKEELAFTFFILFIFFIFFILFIFLLNIAEQLEQFLENHKEVIEYFLV